MKNKICILGNDSLYTKTICKSFDDKDIQYSLILEKEKIIKKGLLSKICNIPLKLESVLNSPSFKALPKISLFTWKLIIKHIIFNKSKKNQKIISPYINYIPKTKTIYYTPNINHVKTMQIIKEHKLDIGIFAGVGIVDKTIINQFIRFCLNAHPAPLPECRGGGALQNTLYYGLKPSASVHYGTAGIDEGKIILVKELELNQKDCFNSISRKLSILCGEVLSEVIINIEKEKEIKAIENKGKLHYWKDCNIKIQKTSYSNLQRLLANIKK